jgi:hypothetical protein
MPTVKIRPLNCDLAMATFNRAPVYLPLPG